MVVAKDIPRWATITKDMLEVREYPTDLAPPRAFGRVEDVVNRIAAHPHQPTHALWQADFSPDCCVVFGSEGYGISPKVLSCCDACVAIPMCSGVDSLNVGNAAAVFLYEANRQRTDARGAGACRFSTDEATET